MPVKQGREYRSFDSTFSAIRDEGESKGYVVEGYATTFDVPYDFGYDGVKEMVKSSAFAGADMSDVIFQLNHEGSPLARQRNGTLELELDDHGLHVRASLGGSARAREVYEEIANGLIDRMSWGFIVPPDGWEWDSDTRTSIITKVTKVFDVSAVSRPADEDTEIHVRSYLDGVIEEEHQELVRREQDRRRRIALAMGM